MAAESSGSTLAGELVEEGAGFEHSKFAKICFTRRGVMGKIEIEKGRVFYPMPCSLVGAKVAGKPNYLTVAWFSMVNPDPPYVGVAMNKAHYTNSGIRENGTFSVNIPSVQMAEVVDYCGLVSGRKADKSGLFESFYGKLDTAPMIRECPFNAECRLVQVVDLPGEELFIGEIVATYCEEDCLTEGVPDLKKINPLGLLMPDRKYLALGQEVGAAWKMGKKFMKK
jgi:flavin reductase (DIM6/NTAB) family NADH-FMN oxidoreductase RutF